MSCERDQAAFLGRLTAGATHELRNVLATIKESAGLISDCIAHAGAVPAPERLQRSLARIDRQVVRGSELLGHLNHLAHCPDQAETVVDLVHEAECMVQLGQRVARQRAAVLQLAALGGEVSGGEVSLRGSEVSLRGSEVSLRVDSLRLQMVLLAALEVLLAQAGEGAAITVHVVAGPPAVVLTAAGAVAQLEGSDAWQRLCELALSLPAEVDTGVPDGLRIVFSRE